MSRRGGHLDLTRDVETRVDTDTITSKRGGGGGGILMIDFCAVPHVVTAADQRRSMCRGPHHAASRSQQDSAERNAS